MSLHTLCKKVSPQHTQYLPRSHSRRYGRGPQTNTNGRWRKPTTTTKLEEIKEEKKEKSDVVTPVLTTATVGAEPSLNKRSKMTR